MRTIVSSLMKTFKVEKGVWTHCRFTFTVYTSHYIQDLGRPIETTIDEYPQNVFVPTPTLLDIPLTPHSFYITISNSKLMSIYLPSV